VFETSLSKHYPKRYFGYFTQDLNTLLGQATVCSDGFTRPPNVPGEDNLEYSGILEWINKELKEPSPDMKRLFFLNEEYVVTIEFRVIKLSKKDVSFYELGVIVNDADNYPTLWWPFQSSDQHLKKEQGKKVTRLINDLML
jgi:hypothetical protein